ncbi:hypothetical protein JCM11491_004899 [Sporobolomyces phaffii]
MAASTSTASYSALLRRSKLAAYNPAIDQVYTTTAPHLARQNFGLKRPLPAATTKTSPFVRVSHLDSREGRTVFRKATREASYVKRWSETGVGLQSEAFVSNLTQGKKWEPLAVQSRFVPDALASPSTGGAIRPPSDSRAPAPRTPNFLAMSEAQFDSFLDQLADRRDAFRAFVADEHAKTNPGAVAEDFDLYAHAQSNPNDLVRLVERFLRLSAPVPSPTTAPLPQIHPTLALQYATPTPLESALAAPIPGRLLGPSPTSTFSRPTGPLSSYRLGGGAELYSSVLSTVTPVSQHHAGGLATTTFYPDASQIRSNVPGRAQFRLVNPSVNPVSYAHRVAIVEAGLRRSTDFRPATAEYEPSLLALKPVALNAVVDTPQHAAHSPALRHPIGSPAYSGALPPELASRQFGGRLDARQGGKGHGGSGGRRGAPVGLSSYFDNGARGDNAAAYKSLGVSERGPRDLLAGKKKKRTKEEQARWLATRESLINDRENDNRRVASARRQGGGQGKASKEGKKEQLLDRLQDLLKA